MEKMKHRKSSVGPRIVLGILCVLIAGLVGFGVYVSDYYRADDTALSAMQSTEAVTVTDEGRYMLFDGPGEGNAYIFYPGAKVETESYAPLLHSIAENGIDVFLVDMPFHFAVFGMNRATDIMAANPDYDTWYLGGHSFGGAMAANYAAGHLDNLAGMILLASYPTKSLDADGFQVLSFYGSEDLVLNMEHYETGREYMPEDYTEVCIDGGNHAQFGNYGAQEGDGTATITAGEQQKIVAETIVEGLLE